VDRFTAIISPPQVGILALGAMREELVPGADGPISRPRMTAVLSSDHRVVYGADAARFLAAFRTILESAHTRTWANDFPEEERGGN
jgi:pyruvate dehydrogenase E2 component (dihydrolipoamide acetyltransferase)